MLENKILSNQVVSDAKRDVAINQSNQNSTDRKFEDAMYESRQQQLNTEQRQNTARNDHAQQLQRQQQDRYQQDQVNARQVSERNAERVNQTRNTDDKPSVTNDVKNTNDSNVDEKDVDSRSSEAVPVKTSNLENTSTENKSNQTVADNVSSEPESDIGVDSSSWLDTFMKIVAHNEQSNQQSEPKTDEINSELNNSDDTENEAQETPVLDKLVLEMENPKDVSTADSNAKEKTEISETLANFLFSSDSSIAEKFTDVDDSKLTEDDSEPTDLSNLLMNKVSDGEAKTKTNEITDTGIVDTDTIDTDTIDTDTIDTDTIDSNSENTEAQKVTSSLLNDTDVSAENNTLNSLGADANKNSDTDYENINFLQKGTPVFSSSVLQQQIQQEFGSDISKQANLLEQGSKTNSVLNFMNPALSELNKGQQVGNTENAPFSTDFDDELDGIKVNSDDVNTNDKKLDSEFKSLLDIKNASLLASGIDGNNKVTEATNKTDVVDVNGVQLDKNLQLPKLEHSSQAKSEILLRENILFNKQEMATHMQQQVGIMMSKNMKSIDIRLDPPELGAMQIKLSMNNDQAAVSFVVSNQQAKDALEASLPRLRELLEQQGMDLAESDVQHGNAQGEAGGQDDPNAENNGNGLLNDDAQDEANLLAQEKLNRAINSPWNVDYYA